MRIFACSDIHGEVRFIDAAHDAIRAADLFIITGDFARRNERHPAAVILKHIEAVTKSVLVVHGNWDEPDFVKTLAERGYSLHAQGKIVDDIGFFGVGGSIPTPMHSPSEYSEEDIQRFLELGYAGVQNARWKVLLTHVPPRGVRDRTIFGLHAGSTAVRHFIETHPVDLCLTGHIHEAAGAATLNDCQVVNLGSFKKGRYAIIDIGVSLSVKTGRIKT